MSRMVACLFAGLLFFGGPAAAANCDLPYPNPLANGSNADATQVMADLEFLRTCINNLPAPTAPVTSSSPRQTVSAGPVTAAGLPNFLPTSSGTLTLSTQLVTSAAPLAVTAANNVDLTTGAQKDLVGITTTGLTWSGLTANATTSNPNYLYVTVAANGALTAGATTQAPVYQWGGTPGTTNGLFTFNIGEMKGYLGNGTAALPATVVFVGEAVTSASAVTSTVAYAYNGRYESAYTQNLPGVASYTSVSHNIGTVPRVADFLMECTTTDRGYAVGDAINALSLALYDGANVGHVVIATTPKTIGIQAGASQAFTAVVKSTGVVAGTYTLTSWRYKFVAQRGW